MPRARKPSWLQMAVELDKYLWSDVSFRQQHVNTLLSTWVNDVPSKKYPDGSILGIPSDCQRADSTRRSLYQAYAALGANFDLPLSWHNIAESHFADDHSVASFATSTYGENLWEDHDIESDTASPARDLKRKRAESDGTEAIQDYLFDQAASHQLMISPQSVRATAFFQASQATIGPIVKVYGTRCKRVKICQAEESDSDEGVSHLFAQDVIHSLSPAGSEGRDTSSGDRAPTNIVAPDPDNELETSPVGLEGRDTSSGDRAPTNILAPDPDNEPETFDGLQNASESTLSDDTFEDLWAYCPFRLHDPTEFEFEACKTRRIAVSHVITHMIKGHRILRGASHDDSTRPEKYLVLCSSVESYNLRGCSRCRRVASWTRDDLVDNASHIGPAICLRCYEAFDRRQDLWFHLRHSPLCLDKGQLLSKSTKAHLLYKTFCSKVTPPSWIPPNSRQSKHSEPNGEPTCPIADHPLGLHPTVPEPEFIASETPALFVQPHGSGGHSDFSSVPHTEWMLPSVHNSIDEWGADDSIGMPDLFRDQWMDSSTLLGNLSTGQSDAIIAGSDHYAFAEETYEWQE